MSVYKPPSEMEPTEQHWYLSLMSEINGVKLLAETIKGMIVPRVDIEAGDRMRVLAETYQSDMRGFNERMTRLEAGPGRFIAWMSLIISGAGCLAVLTVGLFTILGVLYTILHH